MRSVFISEKITNVDDLFKRYITEVGKYDILPETEILRLIDVTRTSNIQSEIDKAKHKICQSNLRFVVTVAKQYSLNPQHFMDTINEGNMGLLYAIDKFDTTLGIKFISYAVWWIRRYMIEFINEDKMIRQPMHMVRVNHKLKNIEAEHISRYGRTPTKDEFEEMYEVDGGDVDKYEAQKNLDVRSVTALKSDDSDMQDLDAFDTYLDDSLETTNKQHNIDYINYRLRSLLNQMDSKTSGILIDLFGIGMENPVPISDVARKHKVGVERIRQLRELALNEARELVDSKLSVVVG